ncbi:MAG: T9SS type A sorting domain-containing protein [candidate division KSB1 bacterium]|nr:T9SS type A sorting domain-containing protein [candidate division KSB1 bacterium]MDZ7288263.1 T9SS type A sorting domain-containing protein [candidate division KSB1 bacterium]MDZ7300475.1 T9SS type A sorting domain-containing protein [candidate division KSB1 bacterium]MDZ7306824.1 T9SS type A sorting domain-containing protein [candidate division KSB1 bacterium]MDZ7351474.1 T9SS type A sorting domain-containing protein [candidate division KSB1 bacterium]
MTNPRRPSVLLAGTNHGVYRSADFGLNWLPGNPPIVDKNIVTMIRKGESDTLYAGTSDTGVFHSADDGRNWLSANPPMDSALVTVLLAVDDTLYAGAYLPGNGLWRSTDGGRQWSRVAFAGAVVNGLYEIDGRLFVILDVGEGISELVFSSDGGRQWNQCQLPREEGFLQTLLAGDEGVLYLGTGRGVWRSRDHGLSWTPPDSSFEFAVTSLLWHQETLLALSYTGIWRSRDKGDTWEHAALPFAHHLSNLRGGKLLAATDEFLTTTLWQSTDGGANWLAAAKFDSRLTALTEARGGLYAGTVHLGILRSTDDSKNWFDASTGLGLRPNLKQAWIDAGLNFILAYGEHGLFRSVDGGLRWNQAALLRPVNDLVEKDGAFLACGSGCYRSTNNGVDWTELPPYPSIFAFSPHVLLVQGNRVLAGTRHGIFFSDDLGDNWQWASPQENFVDVELLASKGSRLLAGYVKRLVTDAGIFFSDDAGVSWQPARFSGRVAALLVANDTAFAGTFENGVFFSTDGENWQPTALNNVTVHALLQAGRRLHAGADNGVFYSDDGGTSWSPAEPPLQGRTVISLFRLNDSTLIAGTRGSGVFRSIDGGIHWTPLETGIDFISEARSFEFVPTFNRLYAATDLGLYFQELDFIPPRLRELGIEGAREFNGKRFTNANEARLVLFADDDPGTARDNAEFMQVSSDSTFAAAEWQVFSQVLNHPLAGDGAKTIHARLRDLSWNLSRTLTAQIVRDTQAPDFAEHHPPQNARIGNEVLITQQIIDSNPQSAELLFRRAGETWNPNIRRVMFAGEAAAIADVWVNNRNIDYRISATDLAGNEATLQNGALDFFSIAVAVTPGALGNSRSLPSGTGGAAYRIVSIPLDLPDSPQAKNVFSDLGKYGRRGDWRCYAYSGNKQWQEGENIQMQTGAGYFMIRRDGGSLTNAISGATTKTADGVLGNISGWQLRGSDWTLIGNPYNTRLELSQLKLKRKGTLLSNHGTEVQVWSYDGQWRNPATEPELALEPWGGLFIRTSEADTIVFANDKEPYARNVAKTGIATTELAEGEWSIQITAASGESSDAVNYFGVRKEAKDDLDNFDWHEPPFLPEGIGLSFPHPEWNEPAELTADFRGIAGDGQRWEIAVKGEPAHAVQLRFANVAAVPEELRVLLVDDATKITHDLRTETALAVRLFDAYPSRRMTILVGNEFYVKQNMAGLPAEPTTFALEQNYPNPFNPSTTIRYQLPVAGRVTLKVFDMVGREVLVLEQNKSREPGYYEIVADLKALTSGVYFYRLSVTGGHEFRATRKMLYVR